MSVITLHDAVVGNTYQVKKVGGSGPVRKRIMDMGITKGVTFLVRKVAPLGDPIQINLRGYELTLRKEDAMQVEIVEVDSEAEKIAY